MPNKKILWLIAIIVIAVLAGGTYYWVKRDQAAGVKNEADQIVVGGQKDAGGCLVGAGYSWCEAKKACLRVWEEYCTAAAPKPATFKCTGDKTVKAVFYPTDDQFVDLTLSDERKMSVPRGLSASGARYAKADESFVFWNKGDTAFIMENGVMTFADCAVAENK